MNGDIWVPVMVEPDDERLIDRTGTLRVATTDPYTMRVYLSSELRGRFLDRVLVHEVCHCALHSYGMLESLHRLIPQESWVDVEEWACNLLADRGREVIHAANTAAGRCVGRCDV